MGDGHIQKVRDSLAKWRVKLPIFRRWSNETISDSDDFIMPVNVPPNASKLGILQDALSRHLAMARIIANTAFTVASDVETLRGVKPDLVIAEVSRMGEEIIWQEDPCWAQGAEHYQLPLDTCCGCRES